jgi:hypothetical protein
LGQIGRFLFALVLTMSVLTGLGLASQERASAEGEVVSIDPATKQVIRGDVFDVDVMIMGAENLWGFEFNLDFDPAVVEVQGVELNAAFWAGSDRTPQELIEDIGAGTLNYVVISDPGADPNEPGPDGDGTLATITLKAIGLGTSPLDLHDTLVYSGEEEREPTEEDGSVTSVVAMAIEPEESVVNPEDVFEVDVMIMGAENLWGFEFSLDFNPAVLEVQGVELGEAFWASSDRSPVELSETVVGGTLNYVVISDPGADPNEPGPDGSGVLATITLKALAKGESALDLNGLETFSGETPETPVGMDGVVYVVDAGVQVLPAATSVSRCDTFEVELALGGDVTNVWGYELNLDWDDELFTVTGVEIDPDFWASSDRSPVEVLEDIGAGTLNYVVISDPGADPNEPGPDAPGVLAVVTLEAIGVGTSDLHLHDVLISEGGTDVGPAKLTDGTAEATPEAVDFVFDTIASPQTAGEQFNVTITAVDEFGDPAQHFSGMVTLSDTTGTLDPTQVEFVDGTPEVTVPVMITKAQADIVITATGTNPCGATMSEDSNAFTVDPDFQDPRGAELTPDPETVTAGDSVVYTLTAWDQYDNEFDATGWAAFSIDAGAGGSFVDNVYTSAIAGTWTVTGVYAGDDNTVSDTAVLTVEPGPLFRIEVLPDPAMVLVGHDQEFTATGYDEFGNAVAPAITPVWSVDDSDAGTIDTAGLFTASFNVGTYVDAVVATDDGVSGAADVTVWAYQIFMPIVAKN